MSNLTTTTQARLKAREDRLEARANMRLDRVKEKINYLKSNSGKIVIDDAIDNLPLQKADRYGHLCTMGGCLIGNLVRIQNSSCYRNVLRR